jgi:hypothetical protein
MRRSALGSLALALACAVAVAALAPRLARAQPGKQTAPQQEEEEEEEEAGPRGAPFLSASIGGGALSDAGPGLTGGDPGLRGHLEVGYGDGRQLSGALSVALGRTGYDNTVPPPEGLQPESTLHVNRVGFGGVAEGRLPLGRLTPIVGAGVYLDRMTAKARGSALGITVDYFDTTDIAIGVEARAGADLRVHAAVELGIRAGWHWSRADFDDLTGGPTWLSGPSIELRATFDASGFRMAPPSARRR